MGLDTSHDCWHGAYSGFAEFRELVGRAAGLPYTVDSRRHPAIDWDRYPNAVYRGRWRKVRPTWIAHGDVYGIPVQDDVLYLIVHSDCDGQLRNGYLPKLKARLEELVPKYEELAAGSTYTAGRLRRFIDGLGRAIEAGEHVEFH